MCGRFSQTKTKQQIKKRFNLTKMTETVEPLFNIAPQRDILAILNESPKELSYVRWGLLPSWSKEEKTPYRMINARAETLLEKPTFKRLVKSKRCLILADSFYEWKKQDGKKRPYRIMLEDEDLFAFAGIWDLWEKEGVVIKSCAIITTEPNELMVEIHDRMPVILKQEHEQAWLKEDDKTAMDLLRAYDSNKMKAYPISTMVNSPTNNSNKILEPVWHGQQ